MTELAQRAVACPGWRWMPGMLPLVVDEDGDCVTCDRVWRTQGGHTVVPAGAFPDLDDPATVGCLLALVREAWGAHDLHVRPSPEGTHWRVYRCATSLNQGWADSEAKALVGALEAAP